MELNEHNKHEHLPIHMSEFDPSLTEESVDLFISVFSQSPWFDVYDSREEVVDFFHAFINMPNFKGYQLLDNIGGVIGISIGFIKPWLKNGRLRYEYFLDQLCIDTGLQGNGYGKIFMSLIERDLKEMGVEDIILNTDMSSPSFHFYKKIGFTDLEGYGFLAKEI